MLVFWTKPFWEESVGEFIPEVISETFQAEVEKPELITPDEQSIFIENVELGDKRVQVEEMYGDPMSESEIEYSVGWPSYYENYPNLMMVAYNDKNIVQGLYTNQDLLSPQVDTALGEGDTKPFLYETLDEPEEIIRNGSFFYQINSEGEYDFYQMDKSYVIAFYDVLALDIDEGLEEEKKAI